MSRGQLIRSRALWRSRETYRKARWQTYARLRDRASGDRRIRLEKLVDKWRGLYVDARKVVDRRTKQIAEVSGPTIITANQLGLTFQYVWGNKGKPYRAAGHYTAGRRVANAEQLKEEARIDHRLHKDKGWGGLSYEYMIADDGTILCGNPVNRMSAAVAVNNTGMLNVCCPGTTGHRMTKEQKESFKWLRSHAHTKKVPSAHRSPVPLYTLTWKVHKKWPSQATACPGDMTQDYEALF